MTSSYLRNTARLQAGVAGAILALALTTGVASAQVASTNTVTVTNTPVTTSPTAGSTAAPFGTITLVGNGGGSYQLASLPITLTTASGGQPADLKSCQLFSAANTAVNTGSNIPTALVNGSNTFVFDQPFAVTGTTTLNIRCNVASAMANGSTYQFVAGTPGFTAGLGVMLVAAPSVPAGTSNAPLALITFDASRSGQSVNVSAVPVTITTNGVASTQFTGCSLRNVTALGTSLNATHAVTINTTGSTAFTLDAPLSIPAGSMTTLALTCNVDPSTPPGGSVTMSVVPSTIMSTLASGAAVTPTAGSTSAGAAPTSGTTTIGGASSTTGSTNTGTGSNTGTGTGSIPAAPNTGAGPDTPANLLILLLSGIVVVAGATFALQTGKNK